MMFITLESNYRSKLVLHSEYTRSLKMPEHFSPMALRSFRINRAKIKKDLDALKVAISKHPDKPKDYVLPKISKL